MTSPQAPDEQNIPNLYALLGIAPLEERPQQIREALVNLAAKIKQLDSPEQVKRSTKLFQLAKFHLLDPARKSAYDAAWCRTFQQTNVVHPELIQAIRVEKSPSRAVATEAGNLAQHTSAPTAGWDLSELTGLLPQGDPLAPWDMARFRRYSSRLVEDSRKSEDLQRDFFKLVQLLDGGSHPEESAPAAQDDLISIGDSTIPALSGSPGSLPVSLLGSQQGSSLRAAQVPAQISAGHATGTIRAQRRKRRSNSMLLAVAAVLTVLSILLAVLVYRSYSQGSGDSLNVLPATVPQQIANQQTPSSESAVAASVPKKSTSGSGLPKPGQAFDSPVPDDAGASGNPSIEPSQNPPKNSGTLDGESIAETSMPIAGSSMMTSPENVPPPMVSSSPAMGSPMAEVVSLNETEKQQWRDLMNQARLALGATEFGQAEQLLATATTLAKVPKQKEQLSRLKTVAELSRHFDDALESALSGMMAGEVITTGSLTVAFVEYDGQRLVVKIRGDSRRFPRGELPINLAHALADLKLDQSPRSTAAKAAFVAVHTKSNENATQSAIKMLQNAAAGEAVPADTFRIFTDDYLLD